MSNLFKILKLGDPKKPEPKPAKNKVEEKVESAKKDYTKYIQSALYLQRLKGMGIENPEQVQKQKAEKVRQIQPSTGVAHLLYGFWDTKQRVQTPKVALEPNDSPYVAMHEVSHANNYGSVISKDENNERPKSLYQASGSSLSLREMLYMTSRLKNKELYKAIRAAAIGNVRSGFYSNPTDGMYGDSHYFNPSEIKSDIDAVRLLLKDNGITKEFGENLTPEMLKKAKENPNISGEHHFQRLMKIYSEKDLIDINNNIAMTGGSQNTTV